MPNNFNQEIDALGLLSVMANMMQLATYLEAQEIETNTDIMKALEMQNKVYLEKIMNKLNEISSKQDEILKKLNEGK